MIKILQLALLFTAAVACRSTEVEDPATSSILINLQYLTNTKMRLKNGDPKIKYAFDKLIKDAELALKNGPYSVTDKEKLPPSGDKHDYASYSRYWWPDPEQPNGLPFIRRDGETNPDSQNDKSSDRPRIGAFGTDTETLGLAYYLTGEEKYAIKAAELLRVWFLNESTRMNPNVNHAQCRPGHNIGSKSGILDGRLLTKALEGSLLISSSSVLSENEYSALQNWASAYLAWLTTNKMALEEADSKNNHGSYYDAQAMYFSLYSNNKKSALNIAKNFMQKRINPQIQSDGSMPKEIERTRPLFYSIYNLHAIFLVAHLAEKVDVDIWEVDVDTSRLRAGLDYLVPYTDQRKPWPLPTIIEADRMDMFPILKMADRIYPEGNYLKIAESLPLERRRIHRANLAFPLMR